MLVRCYRGKLSVWAALCVLVLCWFYIFPVYRLPSDKEIVDEVLRQGQVWQKNQTGIDLYRWVEGISGVVIFCYKAVVPKVGYGDPQGSSGEFLGVSIKKEEEFNII